MKVIKGRYLACSMGLFQCVAVLPCTVLSGETADTLTASQRYELHDVVVTATRTPKLLKDAPIQTRLITEAEIRCSDATNLQDLLQQELPGVEFSYAMNQQVNMNFAGFAGQSVLILLDGERLAGETMDNVDFSRLNLLNVERIEIVKGAASALYGSNATGGVVNIITKDARKRWNLNLNARVAGHRERRYGLAMACAGKYVKNSFTATHTGIDTYTVCRNLSDACDFRNVYGGTTCNFTDKLVFQLPNRLKLTARAGYYFKERLYNPDTPDRYRDFSAGLRGEWNIDERNRLELSYAFDQYDKSDYLKQYHLDVRDYRNVQHVYRALYSNNLLNGDVLTAGFDGMYDFLDSYQFEPGKSHNQYSLDAFLQYDWTVSHHFEVVAAARWDYFSDGKNSNLTAKASACYKLGAFTFRGGYAGGFRAPTLKEKYMNFDMSGIFDIHGNAQLKAEQSHNLNLSAEYARGRYSLTIGGSYNRVHNKIATSSVLYDENNQPYLAYLNVGNLRVWNVEATAQARWNYGLSARLGYNFTHEQTIGSGISQYAPARPHTLHCKFAWTRKWRPKYETTVQLTGRLLSKVSYTSMEMTEPFTSRRVTNPAYTLWKAQISQTLYKGCTLNLALDNLFNYVPKVYAFNSPVTTGTNLMLGLNIDFDKF